MQRQSIEIGSRFARWEITDGPEARGRTKHGKRIWYWFCRCDCGVQRWVAQHNLVYGMSSSCGCRQREVVRARSYKHGGSVGRVLSRLLNIFTGMHVRCENERSLQYKYYGARGITVCAEWRDFVTFREWAMSNGYAPGLTIDRINVNGPYAPDNCRWADAVTQMNNTRRNRWIEAFGECKTVAQWARDDRCTVNAYVLWDRIDKLGWPSETAISTLPGAVKTGPKKNPMRQITRSGPAFFTGVSTESITRT